MLIDAVDGLFRQHVALKVVSRLIPDQNIFDDYTSYYLPYLSLKG